MLVHWTAQREQERDPLRPEGEKCPHLAESTRLRRLPRLSLITTMRWTVSGFTVGTKNIG